MEFGGDDLERGDGGAFELATEGEEGRDIVVIGRRGGEADKAFGDATNAAAAFFAGEFFFSDRGVGGDGDGEGGDGDGAVADHAGALRGVVSAGLCGEFVAGEAECTADKLGFSGGVDGAEGDREVFLGGEQEDAVLDGGDEEVFGGVDGAAALIYVWKF